MGFWGQYYSDQNFTYTLTTRDDGNALNFDTGVVGNPAHTDPYFVSSERLTNGVAVRWDGGFRAKFGEATTFRVDCDNNAKVWINDELILTAGLGVSTFTKTLEAGRSYALRVDFRNDPGSASGNPARLVLKWQSASLPLELVPYAAPPSPPIPLGQLSPIRNFPALLLAEKLKTRPRVAWCWFVQPIRGAAEAYTDWQNALDCPQYVEATGLDDDLNPLYSTTPAQTYAPHHGMKLTSIPTSIRLGVDAADVQVVRLDADKVLRGFYDDAYVEVFEVAVDHLEARTVYFCGTLGNADVDDLSATIELTPFEEMTNQPIGGRIGFFCDVGRLKGERFGCGRCRNTVVNDGPDIADHTRGARIVEVFSRSKFRVEPLAVAKSFGGTGTWPAYESTMPAGKPPIYKSGFPASRGILRGLLSSSGGANQGVQRDIATFDAATGNLLLRQALPFAPAVGDLIEMEAGCDRTLDDCVAWNNRRNFRGFPFVPGRAAVQRRYTL